MVRRALVALGASLAAIAVISACGSDGGGGVDLTCGPGEAACGSRCVDVTNDPANCGACGAACGGVCVNRTCLPTCRLVNGLRWCYDPNNCGQPCNTVCANLGLPLVINDAAWFAAQDTAPECQAINDAFGLGGTVSVGAFTYACVEDWGGAHAAPGGLLGPLFCSTNGNCPTLLRTNVSTPVACGPASRRAICPCQ